MSTDARERELAAIKQILSGIGLHVPSERIQLFGDGDLFITGSDCHRMFGKVPYDAYYWRTDGDKLYNTSKRGGPIVSATFAICYLGFDNWALPTETVLWPGWDINLIKLMAPPQIPTIGG